MYVHRSTRVWPQKSVSDHDIFIGEDKVWNQRFFQRIPRYLRILAYFLNFVCRFFTVCILYKDRHLTF